MYTLYHTLKVNIPKKDLSSKEAKLIEKSLDEMLEDDMEAIFMLIFEHARIEEKYEYSTKNKDLPYGMTYNKNELKMCVENLPLELQWIVYKFCKQRIVPKNEVSKMSKNETSTSTSKAKISTKKK